MRRLRPIKPPRRVTRSEIVQMVRHFERRAKGVAAAAELASRRRTAKSERRGRLWTDAISVKEALELPHALYEGGRFTWEEYFFYCAVPVESLHDHYTMDDYYENKLAPIVSKLRGVEAKHGLEPGQYWPKGQGPAEYYRLHARYEKLLDDEFGKLLREFGLDAHAKLWRGNREEFDRLRKAGRASVFEAADLEHATAKLIDMYESEASKCAKARAFYAACAMLGSASEALILLKCLQNPAELAVARAKISKSKGFHKGGPPFWNLGQLIEIANLAGWVANLETKNVEVYIVNLMTHLHDIRNLVHPGRHAARMPHTSIGYEQYVDAKTAYLAIRFAIEQTTKRPHLGLQGV